MRLIRERAIVEDAFVHVADGTPLPDGIDGIVTLARFRAERASLATRSGRLGVRIPNDLDVAELDGDLAALAVVVVEVPKFTDGRACSQARALREHLRFGGEIRAVGNVLRDQLLYLERCGVSAFELTPGKSLEDALLAFGEQPVRYQAAADERVPIWKREARA